MSEERLPEITVRVRESGRARRLALRIRPPAGVELVVPRGTPARAVDAFLALNRGWVERTEREMRRRYRGERNLLPAVIELAAVNETWQARYRPGSRRRSRAVVLDAATLEVVGPAADAPRALQAWLKARAVSRLAPRLTLAAERLGLEPRCIRVRLQKTRWGSCSARGCVSLNAGLLFLPSEIVDYLLVHELCHLRHLNHSRQFWELVARHCPAYRELDRRLAEGWTRLPAWVFA